MFEGYKYKYRLNARHSMNNQEENVHPHTFEISLYIEQIQGKSFVSFADVDKTVNSFLLRYQNRYLNGIPPFDQLAPTIENMGDVFYGELKNILHKEKFNLVQLEMSETPLRIYLISDRLLYGQIKE